MKSGDWSLINPYQTPAEVPLAAECTPEDRLRQTLGAFRQQIHALGGAWIVFGLFMMLLAQEVSLAGHSARDAYGKVREGNVVASIAAIVAGLFGIAWIASGVGSCLKRLRAVQCGAGLSYIAVAASVLTLNPCTLILFIVVVLQAHRVIGWARELRAAGIPLDARP